MSLRAWYPFNGHYSNMGDGDLSLTQVTAPTYASSGKVSNQSLAGGAFKWSAEQANTVLNNNALSIAFWIQVTTSEGNGILFGTSNMTPPNNRRFSLFNYPSMSDFHWSWQNDNSGGTTNSGVVYGCFPVNTWTHCCITYGNGVSNVYINGEKKGSAKGYVNNSTYGYETTVIHNNTNRRIQDFRVYDHELNPREIKQLAQGLVLHYKLNADNNTNILNQSYNLKNTATGIDSTYGFAIKSVDNSTGTSSKDFQSWSSIITAKYGEIYTLSFYARSSNSTGLTTFLYNNVAGVQVSKAQSSQGTVSTSTDGNCRFKLTPQWQKCWVTYTFNGSRESSAADLAKHLLFRALSGDKADIAMPKLERGAVATPYGIAPDEMATPLIEMDCSGFGNHGTVLSARPAIETDSPRYSNCYKYSGNVNNKISNTTTSFNYTDNFSWSCWVKHNYTGWKATSGAAAASYAFTVGRADAGGYGYGLGESSATGMTVRFGSQGFGVSIDETWHHLAFTKSGTTICIYVDGVLKTSTTFSGTLPTYSDGNGVGLGCFHYSGSIYPFYGSLSDFRIYATPLSAADIKTLYNSSISMAQNGVIQLYESNEELGISNIKMRKMGGINHSGTSEIGYTSSMPVKVLSDGSAWARIHWLDVTNDKTWFASDDEVMFCELSNRFSKMGLVDHFKFTGLPEGYTLLEYIQSSGSQYIDTGHSWASETTKIEVDMTVVTDGTYRSMFGNEEYVDSGSTRYFTGIPHGNGTSYNIYLGTGSITTFPITVGTRFKIGIETTSSKQYTLQKDGTTIGTGSYNGSVQTKAYANITGTNTATTGHIFLFSNHNSQRGTINTATQNMAAMRLYGCKMYERGYLIRNFIPCKNDAGVVGLYDTQTCKFYTTPTGTFTAGAAVDGKYEFMLTYPKLSATAYNRWSQTSSPNQSTVTGFTKINTAWNAHFGGIRRQNGTAVYNVDTGSTWYAAIGQKATWTSTQYIPAADGSSQTETELWVRINNLSQLDKISMLEKKYIQAMQFEEL